MSNMVLIIVVLALLLVYGAIMTLIFASFVKAYLDESKKYTDSFVSKIADLCAAMENQIEALNKRTEWIDDYTNQANGKV